jgi:hypothetical protein
MGAREVKSLAQQIMYAYGGEQMPLQPWHH